MQVGEVFFFILSAFGRLISNLFGHIIVKHYTSSHIILVLILGEIGLAFKEKHEWKEIVQFSLFVFALFILLIFTEIIEINACEKKKNTRKNIQLREELEGDNDIREGILPNESNQANKVEFDGVEFELIRNKSSRSSTKNSPNEQNDDEISEDQKSYE